MNDAQTKALPTKKTAPVLPEQGKTMRLEGAPGQPELTATKNTPYLRNISLTLGGVWKKG